MNTIFAPLVKIFVRKINLRLIYFPIFRHLLHFFSFIFSLLTLIQCIKI